MPSCSLPRDSGRGGSATPPTRLARPSLLAGFHLPRRFDGLVDRADHVERLLRQCVVHALEDLAETAHRLFTRDVLARAAGERLGDEHRLRHEALDLARAANGEL